ncbi:MAG: hypothetical protein QM754_00055 [Tepidisphaeraceae bacterium]
MAAPLSKAPVMRSLDDHFRANATQVLGRLRSSIEGVVYSVTKTLQNSRSLQNALGVDLNVSWQIFKLLGPIETLATITYVPAAVSVKKLLNLAKKRGVAAEALDEVNAAFAAFECLVAETTGDREQFENLVMSFSDSPESQQVGMQLRKAGFKTNVHFFGVAADTVAMALMFHPGSGPNKVDFLNVRTVIGLRRMRASTDVVVERSKVSPERTGRDDDFVLADALDPEAAKFHRAAVIPEFCSQPMLPLTTTVDEAGNVRTVLERCDLGVGQEVDITTGRIYRDTPLIFTPDGNAVFQGLVEIARPTRIQVIDTFVHRPTWPNLKITSGVYAHLTSRNTMDAERTGVRLPCPEKLVYMGSGEDMLRISEAPRYPELVKYACRKMNWSFEDMDLYRIRLEYPLMDSNVLCRLESTV